MATFNIRDRAQGWGAEMLERRAQIQAQNGGHDQAFANWMKAGGEASGVSFAELLQAKNRPVQTSATPTLSTANTRQAAQSGQTADQLKAQRQTNDQQMHEAMLAGNMDVYRSLEAENKEIKSRLDAIEAEETKKRQYAEAIASAQQAAEAKSRGQSYDEWYNAALAQNETAAAAEKELKRRLQAAKDQRSQGYWDNGVYMGEDHSRDQEIAQMEAELKRLQNEASAARDSLRYAGWWRYEDLPQMQDYAQQVQAGRNAFRTEEKPESNQAAINAAIIAGSTNPYAAGYLMAQDYYRTDTSWREPGEGWTMQQKNNFYYLYGKDREEAYAYAQGLNDQLAYQKRMAEMQKASDWAQQNGWTGFAGTGGSILSAPFALVDYVDMANEYAARGTITQRDYASFADYGDAMESGVAEKLNEIGTIDEGLLEGKGIGDVYQLGVGTIQSVTYGNLLGPFGQAAVAFGEAAKSGMDDAIQRGATPEQALLFGTMCGLSEAAGEYFSIDKLLSMKNPETLSQFFLSFLKQGGVEASENDMTTLLNTVSDAWIMGDKSQVELNVQGYMRQGMTEEEARKQAMKDWTNGVAWDTIGGFASGGFASTLQQAGQSAFSRGRQAAQERAEWRQAGRLENEQLQAAGGVQTQDAAGAAVQVSQAASRAVFNALASGRINATTANEIASSPELRQAFTNATGISLDGTTYENRTAIQNAAREFAYNRGQAQAAAEQYATVAQEQAAQEKAAAQANAAEEQSAEISDSMAENYASYIRGMMLDGMTVAHAREILRSPELKQTWERMSGIKLPESNNRAVDIIRTTPLPAEGFSQEQGRSGRNPELEKVDWIWDALHPEEAESAAEAQTQSGNITTPPAAQNAQEAASRGLQEANRAAIEQKNGSHSPGTAGNSGGSHGNAYAPNNSISNAGGNVNGNLRERGFSRNVRTDAAMEEGIRESFNENPETYSVLSNADTLRKARAIYESGFEQAKSQLREALGAAKAGQKLAPEMVPLSRMVANEMTRQGDISGAREILSDVAAELTSAGQLGQAGQILRNADPVTVLNTLQKAIDQINSEVQKKGGRKGWQAELTQEEIQQIADTDFSREGAFEEVQQQIAARLGREMPATLAEKLREVRKVGMLLNPKTQIKNVAGNMPLLGERKIAETLSGGLQDLAVRAGIMQKENQTRTLRVGKEHRALAAEIYKQNIETLRGQGNKGELRGALRNSRTYFDKGLLQKGIERVTGHQLDDAAMDYVRRATYDLLERGDAPFVKSAFIDNMAQYCAAHGISAESEVTQEAINYATDQAMAATFKDASALAKLLNNIKDNAGLAGEALDVIFPFTTTPINIGKEFAKYSPLGYLQLLNAGGKGGAEIADIVSRATTGTAVVALGVVLRSLGAITGAADDDKDKAAHDKAMGISPYSFGGQVSYEWMQPTGSALAMGAAIYDATQNDGNFWSTVLDAIIAGGDAYLEQSFFQDIIDLFRGYGSPTENLLTTLLESTVSQFNPSVVGALARTIDPTVRTSYTGGNALESALSAVGARTPGISQNMPASVDVSGQEISRGNLWERIADNWLFPWTTNRNGGSATEVDKAIDEVYAATGDKTIYRQVSPYKVDYGGETYEMTGEERAAFQTTQGQTYNQIIQQAIDSGVWANLSDEAKVKTMQEANKYALDQAKRDLVEARGGEFSSDLDKLDTMKNAGTYITAKAAFSTVSGGRENYAALDSLLKQFDALPMDVQTALKEDSALHVRQLTFAAENGISSEAWYKTYEAVQEAKAKTGSQAQVVTAAAVARSVSGNEAQKLDALEAQLTPDKETGKRQAIVRRYETAMSIGATFDEWTKFEATLSDVNEGGGTPNKAEIYQAAEASGIGLDADTVYAIYKKYYNDENYVSVYNEDYAQANPGTSQAEGQRLTEYLGVQNGSTSSLVDEINNILIQAGIPLWNPGQ